MTAPSGILNVENRASDRLYYFDCLRIFALVIVIFVHAAAQKWLEVDVWSFEWNAFNLYDGLSRGGSAFFVMISGALFLGKDRPLETIYRKHLLRIVIAFAFWSAVYAAVDRAHGIVALDDWRKGADVPVTWFQHFMRGHYHMWFLYMIAGIYLIVPLLRKIAETDFLRNYFLLLALIFTIAIPQTVFVIGLCSEEWGAFAAEIFKKFDVHLVLGCPGYFVLGYALSKANPGERTRRAIYVLGLLGAAATVLLTMVLSLRKGEPDVTFYDHFTFNVLIKCIAVFLFAKERWGLAGASEGAKALVSALSRYTFGAYLVHALVLEEMDRLFNFNTFSFNPLLSIPLIVAVVFVVSMAISAVLNRIPVLRKLV